MWTVDCFVCSQSSMLGFTWALFLLWVFLNQLLLKEQGSPRFHWSTLLFVHFLAVATVKALPVLKIRDAQQEYGQLLPAEQCRIPPSHSHHHFTSTPAISSPSLRIPTGLRAFSPTLPVCQSQPFTVVALTFFKPLSVCDLKDVVSGPTYPAGQDSLFPGACLP